MKKALKNIALVIFSLIICVSSQIPSFSADSSAKAMANLIVFVRFADDAETNVFESTTDRILRMYNDTTDVYPTYKIDYSFKAYINAISRGKLQVNNIFPQYDGEIITPLTLSSAKSAYDDSAVLQEVVNAFNSGKLTLPSGVKYDNEYSGSLDNLTVILQGRADSTSDMMWPHKAVAALSSRLCGYYVGDYNFINSHTLLDLQEQGVIAHEFMHSAGFPDLYRYSGTGNPVGYWDVMASNSYFLQYPLSYQRYKMGWVPMNKITASGEYTLDAVSSDSDNILLQIRTPMSDNEFFVIEYRKKVTDAPINLGFETKIPSSGLLIYRVNEGIENLSNAAGEDYIYVFRPGDTSATASEGDILSAAIDPSAGETSYGVSDFSATVSDNTIFYSNGLNSGIVIGDVTYSDDMSSISFRLDLPDYTSLGLWDNFGTSAASDAMLTKTVADSDGNLYLCATRQVNWKNTLALYKYDSSANLTLAAPLISGVYDANVTVFNGEIYVVYSNSNGNPVVAKLKSSSWSVIYTDTSVSYPNSPQLFDDGERLYAGWIKDSTTACIKEITSSGAVSVNSSLTSEYFADPIFIAKGDNVYVLYCDFSFSGATYYTKLKCFNRISGVWQELTIPSPVASSNTHAACKGKNGELLFVAAKSGVNPILITVADDGSITQKEIPHTAASFIGIGVGVTHSNQVCVGLFDYSDNSKVVYYDSGEWNELGSSPCASSSSVSMTVIGSGVYVASVAENSGILTVKTKEVPQKILPRLAAREQTGISVSDKYILGVPQGAQNLELYFDVTENGYFTYTGTATGEELSLYTQGGELVRTYIIIVYGDVDGDGLADGRDSVIISAIVQGLITPQEHITLAADADISSVVDEDDVTAAFNSGLL